MASSRRLRSILTAAVLAVSAVAGTGPSDVLAQPVDAVPAVRTIRGTTAPKDRYKLRFDIRGIVAESPKQKGDTVKKGELLIRLNDTEQRAQLRARELDADVTLAVAEAEQELKVAELTLAKTERSYNNQGATELELETDRAKVEIAKIKVDQARRQGAISAASADAQRALVERMSMFAPIDGVLVDVFAKQGEGVDESRDVIEIIDRSTLYIDVRLAEIAAVRQLRKGQTMKVQLSGETTWRDATINFIAPEADAKAGTLPFRLELKNPDDRQPGEDVLVQLPQSGGVAAR